MDAVSGTQQADTPTGPPPAPEAAPPSPPERRKRRAPTAGDMFRSLLVLLIPVLIITWIFTRTPDKPDVPTVNWQPVYATAQKSADYRLLTPSGLSADWRATQVHWTPAGTSDEAGNVSAGNAWTLGLLSPHTIYFAIRQTDGPAQPFIAQVTSNGTPDGASTIQGEAWTRYVSENGRTHALVRQAGKVTSIVVADASYDQLDSFAGHLRS